jgi:hypothetical protein
MTREVVAELEASELIRKGLNPARSGARERYRIWKAEPQITQRSTLG